MKEYVDIQRTLHNSINFNLNFILLIYFHNNKR